VSRPGLATRKARSCLFKQRTPQKAGCVGGYNESMNKMADIEFTQAELGAIAAINDARSQGQPTSKVLQISQKLVEHGYITHGDDGRLILTAKGKRMLRPGDTA